MISKETKAKIDLLSIDELREEFVKGSSSRFQGEQLDYLVARLIKLQDEKREAEYKESIELQGKHLKAAEEANRIAEKANKLSNIAILVSIFAFLISLFSLILKSL